MVAQTPEEVAREASLKSVTANAVPLANIVELATSVISKMTGKDIADKINDVSLSRTVLSNIVANRIKEKVLKGV